MMECLITGCQARQDVFVVNGDLHFMREQGVYIFNAVLNSEGEAAWEKDFKATNPMTKEIDITFSTQRFERRGVIVVSVLGSKLNWAALDYIV